MDQIHFVLFYIPEIQEDLLSEHGLIRVTEILLVMIIIFIIKHFRNLMMKLFPLNLSECSQQSKFVRKLTDNNPTFRAD